MDAPYPRLVVDDVAAGFRFYDGVLPALVGAVRGRGDGSGPYASWDVGDATRLALIDRRLMAGAASDAPAAVSVAAPPAAAGPPAAARPDRVVLVFRVRDVNAAVELCVRHGAGLVTPAGDRPEWGPTMRVAHLRDPAGTLIELQSY